MCVIIAMAAGSTINKRQLFNAVYNNWQGFGIVLKDQNNRMEVIRKFDPNGTDPEEVWKILEDNKDIERILHVRYCTKGAADEANTQPFEVFNSEKRRVFFFHNGTLPSYGANTSGMGKSDTLEFSEKVLQPALLRWTGEKGKADYTDEAFVSLILDKHWTSTSRGLLYSNDLDPLRMGNNWSEYKHPDDSSEGLIYVSTTDYFDRIQRGPMFQKLEEARKAKEAQEAAERAKTNGAIVPFSSPSSSSSDIVKIWGNNNSKSPKVIKAVQDIINTWDLDDPAKIAKLRFVAYDEWLAVIETEGEYTAAAIIEVFAKHIGDLSVKNAGLIRKQKNAEQRIIDLQKKVRNDDDQAAA